MLSLSLLSLFLSTPLYAAPSFSGLDLASSQTKSVETGKKGTVLVFLSAHCPCSHSHLPLLKKMAADFKDFSFVGIHSNADETVNEAKTYFSAAQLPFPVLQDAQSKFADEYKALKTPHAFVLSPDGKILYKGGVTSSASGSASDKQYLRNALTNLVDGKAVELAQTRTLGCVIER